MRQTRQDRSQELLDKYMEYHEKKVRRGAVSPLDGIERATLDIFLNWLCERYVVTGAQHK